MKPINLKTPEGRHSFYLSPEWKALRTLVLIRDIWCVECLKNGIYILSTDVDHILPIEKCPERFADMTNLQGLCKSCHSQKTVAESETKFGKKKTTYTTVNRRWQV